MEILSNKEKLLKVWPGAVAIQTEANVEQESYWWIYCGDHLLGANEERLGRGVTEEAAWQNAAESLPAQPEQKSITPCTGDPAGTGFCEFHECENDCQSVESLPVEAKEKDQYIRAIDLLLAVEDEGFHINNCTDLHKDIEGLLEDWRHLVDTKAEPKPTPSTPADMGCEGCGEPVYLTRGYGYWHVDTTLNVSCDARPKSSHPSVPQPQPASISSDQLAWKTIEFAPKDGSVFLGRKHNQAYMTQSSRHYVKFPHEDGGPTFRDVWNQIHPDAVYVWNPTHWIELDIWAAAKGSTDTEGR